MSWKLLDTHETLAMTYLNEFGRWHAAQRRVLMQEFNKDRGGYQSRTRYAPLCHPGLRVMQESHIGHIPRKHHRICKTGQSMLDRMSKKGKHHGR